MIDSERKKQKTKHFAITWDKQREASCANKDLSFLFVMSSDGNKWFLNDYYALTLLTLCAIQTRYTEVDILGD